MSGSTDPLLHHNEQDMSCWDEHSAWLSTPRPPNLHPTIIQRQSLRCKGFAGFNPYIPHDEYIFAINLGTARHRRRSRACEPFWASHLRLRKLAAWSKRCEDGKSKNGRERLMKTLKSKGVTKQGSRTGKPSKIGEAAHTFSCGGDPCRKS